MRRGSIRRPGPPIGRRAAAVPARRVWPVRRGRRRPRCRRTRAGGASCGPPVAAQQPAEPQAGHVGAEHHADGVGGVAEHGRTAATSATSRTRAVPPVRKKAASTMARGRDGMSFAAESAPRPARRRQSRSRAHKRCPAARDAHGPWERRAVSIPAVAGVRMREGRQEGVVRCSLFVQRPEQGPVRAMRAVRLPRTTNNEQRTTPYVLPLSRSSSLFGQAAWTSTAS